MADAADFRRIALLGAVVRLKVRLGDKALLIDTFNAGAAALPGGERLSRSGSAGTTLSCSRAGENTQDATDVQPDCFVSLATTVRSRALSHSRSRSRTPMVRRWSQVSVT
jgi:hypothetical protein